MWGIDSATLAIRKAKEKAAGRGHQVNCIVLNVLEFSRLNRKFNAVADSGLFHNLSDEDRPLFVDDLAAILPRAGTTSCSASAIWSPTNTVREG